MAGVWRELVDGADTTSAMNGALGVDVLICGLIGHDVEFVGFAVFVCGGLFAVTVALDGSSC